MAKKAMRLQGKGVREDTLTRAIQNALGTQPGQTTTTTIGIDVDESDAKSSLRDIQKEINNTKFRIRDLGSEISSVFQVASKHSFFGEVGEIDLEILKRLSQNLVNISENKLPDFHKQIGLTDLDPDEVYKLNTIRGKHSSAINLSEIESVLEAIDDDVAMRTLKRTLNKFDVLDRANENWNLDESYLNFIRKQIVGEGLTRKGIEALVDNYGQMISDGLLPKVRGQALPKVGEQAAQYFENIFTEGKFDFSLDELIGKLRSDGVGEDSLDYLQNRLNEIKDTGVEIQKVFSTVTDGKLTSVGIQGTDRRGTTLTRVDTLRYNKETKQNEWHSSEKQTTNFDQERKAAQDLTNILNQLYKAQGEIAAQNAKFGQEDQFSTTLSDLSKDIDSALQMAKADDATSNLSQLSNVLTEIQAKVKGVTAQTKEWHAVNSTKSEIAKAQQRQKELQSQYDVLTSSYKSYTDPNSSNYNEDVAKQFTNVADAIKSIETNAKNADIASTLFKNLKNTVKDLKADTDSSSKVIKDLGDAYTKAAASANKYVQAALKNKKTDKTQEVLAEEQKKSFEEYTKLRERLKNEFGMSDEEIDLKLPSIKAMDANISDSLTQYYDNVVKSFEEIQTKIQSLTEGNTKEVFTHSIEGVAKNVQALQDAFQSGKYDFSKFEDVKQFISDIQQIVPQIENVKTSLSSTLSKKSIKIDEMISDMLDAKNLEGKTASFKAEVEKIQREVSALLENKDGKSESEISKELDLISTKLKEMAKSAQYVRTTSKGSIIESTIGKVSDVQDVYKELQKMAASQGLGKELQNRLKIDTANGSVTTYFQKTNGEVVQLTGHLEKLANGFNQVRVQQSQLSGGTGFLRGMSEEAQNLAKAMTFAFGGQQMFHKLSQSLRNGIEDIKNYNTALTNISYTMDVTSKGLDNIGKSAINLAKELHMSIDNATQIYQIYSNMQATAEEIETTAKPTAILSNLAGVSANEASNYIQSVMNQFDMAEDKAAHIADVYDYVSSQIRVDYASGIAGIAEAVQNVGNVAESAGLSFEQLSSIIGKTMEQTRQSGSTISNSLRTILTRTSKASKFSDEVDNETLSNASKALHEVGVEVYTATGEFREFDTIMTELAEVFPKLTSAQQAYVSFQLAATRNTSTFRAILDNWTTSMEMANKAVDANGNALANQEKYQESYAGQLQEIHTQISSFWIGLLDSKASHVVLDFVINLTKALNKLSEVSNIFGVGGGLIGILAGATALKKGISFLFNGGISGLARNILTQGAVINAQGDSNKMKDILGGLGSVTRGASFLKRAKDLDQTQKISLLVDSGLAKDATEAEQALLKLNQTSGTAVSGIDRLKTGFSNLASAIGISTAALGVAIGVIGGLALAYVGWQKYQEHIQKQIDEVVSKSSDWGKTESSISTSIDRVQELNDVLSSGTATESEVYNAKSELLEIQNALNESYGSYAAGIDLVNGNLDQEISKLEELSVQQARLFLDDIDNNGIGVQRIKNIIEDTRKWSPSVFDGTSAEKDFLKQLSDKYGLALEDDGIGIVSLTFEGNAIDLEKTIESVKTDIYAMQKSLGDENFLSGFYSQFGNFLPYLQDDLTNYLDSYNKIIEAELKTSVKPYEGKTASQWYSDYSAAIKKYNQAIVNDEGFDQAEIELNQMQTQIDSLLADESGLGQFATYFATIAETINTADGAAYKFKEQFSDIMKLSTYDRDGVHDYLGAYYKELYGANQSKAEFGRTVFGNIDLDDRQVLKWTNANLEKYKYALSSFNEGIPWDELKAQFIDTISTVYTDVDERFEVPIAVTPLLQMDDSDEPMMLNKVQLRKYVSQLIESAKADDGIWSNEELFALDAEGFEIDGVTIKNVIADIGETAIHTAETMHYLGEDGSLNYIKKEFEDLYGMDPTTLTDSQKELLLNLEAIHEMKLTDIELEQHLNKQDGDRWIYLAQLAEEYGVSIEDLVDTLTEYGVVSGKVEYTNEKIENSYSKAVVDANKLVETIGKVNSAINAQASGKSISYDAFNSDELSEYTSALELHNGALQLNIDKVKELQKEKVNEAIAENESIKARQQADYIKNASEIERLNQKIKDHNYAEGESTKSITEQITALTNSNSAIASQCTQLDLLNANLRESTGLYQSWLDAQSEPEYGTMFDDSVKAIQQIKDVWDSNSDSAGNFGSRKYNAALEMIIPEDVDTTDQQAISNYLKQLGKYYYNEGKDMNISQFLSDAVTEGLMNQDGDDFQIVAGKTMEDFAEALHLSLPVVQAFFDELQLKGGEFDWSDEMVKSIGDLGMAATDAASRLKDLESAKNLKIKIDVSDLENDEDKIAALQQTIDSVTELRDGKLTVDSSEYKDANAIIEYCIAQMQILQSPAILQVDASQVDGEIGEALTLLQEFQLASNQLDMQAALGYDTTEAQANVDALASKISELPDETKANIGLNIEENAVADITSYIEGLTLPDLETKFHTDTSEIETGMDLLEDINAYPIHDKRFTVKAIDNASSPLRAIKDEYDKLKDKNITITTTRVTQTQTSGGGATGTDRLQGTAHANGNWGTSKGGQTLVGELG